MITLAAAALLAAPNLSTGPIEFEDLVRIREISEEVCPVAFEHSDAKVILEEAHSDYGLSLTQQILLTSFCLLYSNGRQHGMEEAIKIAREIRKEQSAVVP